ncbi:MAG: MFS transporter [Chloroflexi bacterium]|nr:MFS transporter [Chloroflexota bacterium]
MSDQSSAKRLPDLRHASWNFWWLVFDGFVFAFGFTFISPSSILPVFVARLTPIDLLAGAVPAIDFVGLALPQILGARWAARSARRGGRKRFVLIAAGIGRIPMLAPIVATAVYGDTEPGIALASLLIGLGLFRLSEGIVLPAYFDIVGAVVPPPRRARYFALQQASGAVGGVASAFGARWLLANLPFPWGFVTCFALGTFFVSFVLVVFAQVKDGGAISPRSFPATRHSVSCLWGDRSQHLPAWRPPTTQSPRSGASERQMRMARLSAPSCLQAVSPAHSCGVRLPDDTGIPCSSRLARPSAQARRFRQSSHRTWCGFLAPLPLSGLRVQRSAWPTRRCLSLSPNGPFRSPLPPL